MGTTEKSSVRAPGETMHPIAHAFLVFAIELTTICGVSICANSTNRRRMLRKASVNRTVQTNFPEVGSGQVFILDERTGEGKFWPAAK